METDECIRRTVRALLAIRGMPWTQFAAEVGMTKATYFGRMRGDRGPWTAQEVAQAAEVLGVPIETLFTGIQVDRRATA